MNTPRIALIAAVLSAALVVPATASAQAPVAGNGSVADAMIDRANQLDAQIKLKTAEMQARKAKIKQLNADLAKAKAAGITKLAAQIKTQLDALMAQDQLAMIELQALMNKYSQAVEAMSNLLAKFGQAQSGIIRNLRP